jgi:hypothetical protein
MQEVPLPDVNASNLGDTRHTDENAMESAKDLWSFMMRNGYEGKLRMEDMMGLAKKKISKTRDASEGSAA